MAQIEAADGAAGTGGEIGIWPENWDIVGAFAAVSTQWRTAPLARGGLHYLGLDYAGAQAGLELASVTVTSELWDGIRVMEREAIAALNGS